MLQLSRLHHPVLAAIPFHHVFLTFLFKFGLLSHQICFELFFENSSLNLVQPPPRGLTVLAFVDLDSCHTLFGYKFDCYNTLSCR